MTHTVTCPACGAEHEAPPVVDERAAATMAAQQGEIDALRKELAQCRAKLAGRTFDTEPAVSVADAELLDYLHQWADARKERP